MRRNILSIMWITCLSAIFCCSCQNARDVKGTEEKETYLVELDQASKEEWATASSMQGVLAVYGHHIYLKKANDFWAESFKKNGVKVKTTIHSLDSLFITFENELGSYVVADKGNFSVGATVAGPLKAFVITEDILTQSPYIMHHSQQVYDVRGKDDHWLYDYVTAHLDKYNLNAITQHNGGNPASLIDFAIANRYICMICQDEPELIRKFYALVRPNSPKFGFGTPYHNEIKDVSLSAEYGLYTVPTANTWNLSFFSAFPALEKQKPAEISPKKNEGKNVHRVMIMISDGDNLNWTIGGCISNPKYMGNELCANYPINWMYPPEAMNAAGYVHNYYMKNRPHYNYLMGAVSGQGYTYPSRHKDLDGLCDKTAESYRRAGLDYCVLMDVEDFITTEKEVLTKVVKKIPELKGIYYMDYSNYAKWEGDSYLIDGTPVHAFRYRLWLPMDPLEKIAEKINASSTDPTKLDAYSSVVVHAWSYGMNDVRRFIDLLDDDVILVNAEEFMDALYDNVLTK